MNICNWKIMEDGTDLALTAARETQRKLASIQVVENVIKHWNADSLEISTLEGLGWQVVVNVNENIKKKDKVVYCEIDCLLPGSANYLPEAIKQLVEKQANKDWFRVKTIKLRSEISQGLIIPLSNFEKDMKETLEALDEGENVTQLLNIGKYEPTCGVSEVRSGPRVSTFPSHLLDKTDEIRIQSSTKLLNEIEGQEYYVSVKCDGMSGTFLVDPDTKEFVVCSRNQVRQKDDACDYWRVATKYNLEDKLKNDKFSGYAIQGEVCGPKIQKNLLNLKDVDFFVFNIVDLKHRQRLSFEEMNMVCNELQLKQVDIVEHDTKFECCKFKAADEEGRTLIDTKSTINKLLKLAEGKYPNSKHQREGIVIRSKDGRISFKVINNQYLLKNDL